jgi:hypothetical protein
MEDDVIAKTPIQMYQGIAGRDGDSKTPGYVAAVVMSQ